MTRLNNSHESAYAALANELRQALLQGTYADGTQLPTEAELANAHQVSRQTVRRAMQDLVAEGMIFRVRGRGTFQAAPDTRYLRQFGSVEDLIALPLDIQIDLEQPLQHKIDTQAASRLRLASDNVMTAQFLRLHDDIPLCFVTVYLPPDIGRLIEDVPALTTPGIGTTTTILALLDQRAPRPIVESQQSISVTVAPSVATALGCPPEQALLRIDRLYCDADETPVHLTISWFHPDRYSYRVRLRRNHS